MNTFNSTQLCNVVPFLNCSGMTLSCKPDRRPLVSDFPFQKETTQKVDYIKWPVCSLVTHNREAYLPPEGCMSGDTNYRSAYDVKPLCPNPSMKPNPRKCLPGKFDDMTSNKADYIRYLVLYYLENPPPPPPLPRPVQAAGCQHYVLQLIACQYLVKWLFSHWFCRWENKLLSVAQNISAQIRSVWGLKILI